MRIAVYMTTATGMPGATETIDLGGQRLVVLKIRDQGDIQRTGEGRQKLAHVLK